VTTTIGNNTNGASAATLDTYCRWNDGVNIVYTTPAGTQNVVSLDVRCSVTSGSGTIRCAVFTLAGAFVMQWDNYTTVTQTTPGWVSRTAFVDQAKNAIATPTLSGATGYILAAAGVGSTLSVQYDATTSGYMKYNSAVNYQGGFAATLPAATNSGAQICIRCVMSAAVTANIPAAMHHLKMMRARY
jgi:hypothetical protein